MREVVRLVQGLRRDAHCQPQEKINLLIKAPEELKTILENKKDFLKKEINTREIKFEVSDKLDAEIKKISI